DETAHYFNQPMTTDKELIEGARAWKRKGAQAVLLTKDNEKVVYSGFDQTNEIVYTHPENNEENYKWGVSEALGAGWVYGVYQHKTHEESLWYALSNAYMTAKKGYTVRPELSQKVLEKDAKQYKGYWQEELLN